MTRLRFFARCLVGGIFEDLLAGEGRIQPAATRRRSSLHMEISFEEPLTVVEKETRLLRGPCDVCGGSGAESGSR